MAHAFPASVRRRYERLRSFPEGLLVVGDAICSFNPTYGQGMTVAAAEAVALHECLEDGPRDLARRFFAAAAAPVDHAWTLSTGADLALPAVAAPRPRRVRMLNAYMRRLHATAEGDPLVAGAFIAVVGMREPPPAPHAARGRPPGAARAARARVAGGDAGVRRRELRVNGVRTPLREAGPADAAEAVVFLHGNPGSGADWEPLLAAAGRRLRAVAWDAPGFGRSEAEGFPQSVPDHAAFVGRALDELGIERAHLVAHDFGGPWGLSWAAADPDRFASAVLIGTGALPGYRWHALARVWRARGAGEAFMATTTRLGFRALMRRGNPRGLPRAFVDRMYDDFDRGTRRAVLDLYRSVADVGGAGERSRPRCGRSTGPPWCCGAATTRTCRSPTPSASARRSRAPRCGCSSAAATGPSPTTPPRWPPRWTGSSPGCRNGERSGWPEGSVRGGSCRYRPRESRSRSPPFVGPAGKGSRPHGCRRALVSGPDPHGRPALHGPARF